MKRVMVNLDDVTGEMLESRAANDKRSVSGYLAVLVEKDLRAAGLMPGDDTKAEEILAAAGELGPDHALKILRNAKRRKTAA